jgi:hypothetical protein
VFTRTIQVLIHWEAVKLWLKGIPTFEHPNGTDVDLGFGISGKKLGEFLWTLMRPGYEIYNRIRNSSKK